MAAHMDLSKQEVDLQGLLAEGRALQKTFATATSDHGVYVEKCIDASERILAAAKNAQEASTVNFARPLSGHAIVLVLIDGMSHQFIDDLYRNRQSGGAETAKRLRAVVGERVATILPAVAKSGYHTVKIFACLRTLSRRVATEKLAAREPRSLANHFAEFTKVSPFFDFVDTGDEGHVPTKISENFKFYMTDPNCKHVFFAASGSPMYPRTLGPYRGQIEKVTVVRGTSSIGRINELWFPVVAFGNVFSVPLSGMTQVGGGTQINGAAESDGTDTVAKTHSHSNENLVTSRTVVDTDRQAPKAALYESGLPFCHINGRLPVNAAGQRIDLYVRKPSAADIDMFEARYKRHKMCNKHYLGAGCTLGSCRYYHGVLEPGAYQVLRYKVLGVPCEERAHCRTLDCPYGHVCPQDKCAKFDKGFKRCLLPESMHGMDLKVATWVVPSGVQVIGEAVLTTPASMEDLQPYDDIEDLIDFD